MRACAIFEESMVLSLWMSSGPTMPATISARIPEEGAGAVPPQRVGVVGSLLGLWHRHLHRLVAGLRGRILDLRQLRLFTDLGEAVDRGATAGEAGYGQQGAGDDQAVDTEN